MRSQSERRGTVITNFQGIYSRFFEIFLNFFCAVITPTILQNVLGIVPYFYVVAASKITPASSISLSNTDV